MSDCPSYPNLSPGAGQQINGATQNVIGAAQDPNKPINFISGKRAFFPEKLLEKRSMNEDIELTEEFSDWRLIQFFDDRKTLISLFSFISNSEESAIASKRRRGMNASIATFANKNPKFTVIEPPLINVDAATQNLES